MSDNEPEKGKKKFKMPNTYVILFGVICFIAVLSWFVPGGAYELNANGDAISGTYHIVESNPQGLWDVFMAPITGMLGSGAISGAIAISLTILLFGSFLEMMEETGAVKTALKRITMKNRNNMHLLIAILVCLMSFLGTLEGAYEEGIVYFLMFVPVILALGLDTVVAIMIVVLGTQAGCLASTVNPFATGIASGIAGISAGDGMGMRVLMLVVFTGLVIFIINRYADKVKAHPEKSVQFFRRKLDLIEFPVSADENLELSGRQKGVLAIFVLTFAIMVVGCVPWTSINPDWTFFEQFVSWIGVTPVLREVLGSDITPFGSWYFPEIAMLVMVMTLLAGIVMRYKADKIIDTLIKGAAGLVSTAFVVPLARGIQVVMDGGQITPTILHMCESTLSALPPVAFVIVALICYFLIACLIPSSTGLAAATMGIMAALSQFAGVDVAIQAEGFKASSAAASLSKPSFKFATGSSAAKAVVAKDGTVTITLKKGESYTAADIQALLEKATTGTASGSKASDALMDSVKNSKVTGNGVTKVGAQGVAATSGTQAQDKGKELTLQIGDTSAAYNQLKVSIKDCHVDALNLTDMKISDQESAGKALDMIKNAINYVSDVRGTLGATQNRLDHTINNLSVMQENIQDAESTIRDTDVADEMMAYTKNNILIQSAQAMLAQANQVPQGVLQLLQ